MLRRRSRPRQIWRLGMLLCDESSLNQLSWTLVTGYSLPPYRKLRSMGTGMPCSNSLARDMLR